MNDKITWIAECGSNHNQKISRAVELIKQCSEIGFTGVKFQLFKHTLWSDQNTQEQMKKWALNRLWVPFLCTYAHELGLTFGVSVFDINAIDIAFKANVDFIKIASNEILREDLLKACRETNIPIHLSTGMATGAEINQAVINIQRIYERKMILYHCCSKYPAKYSECELWKINKLNHVWANNYQIGWSDHTAHANIIFEAYNRGASIFELHIDLHDGIGKEYSIGHCWNIKKAQQVILNLNEKINNQKSPDYTELRKKRTNPKTGQRPC